MLQEILQNVWLVVEFKGNKQNLQKGIIIKVDVRWYRYYC